MSMFDFSRAYQNEFPKGKYRETPKDYVEGELTVVEEEPKQITKEKDPDS